RAHAHPRHLIVGMIRCFNVYVHHYFLICAKLAFFAAVYGVLFSFFKSHIIPIPVLVIWHRGIILLYTSFYFLKKIFLKPFRVLHFAFAECVFGIQVFYHFWIFPIAQPEVIIGAIITMNG